jgi:Flp pilus assembly protein TadG
MAAFCLSPANCFQRFRRNQNGAAAIEFAFVAIPFFALMFAIVQTAMVFFFSQVLETATADSARLILTGQVKSKSLSKSDFHQEVCNRVSGLFDCTKILVDVNVAANFAAANVSKLQESDLKNNASTWNPGVGGDIVIVRTAYAMPIWVSAWGIGLADSDNQYVLTATSAFRNEPFL